MNPLTEATQELLQLEGSVLRLLCTNCACCAKGLRDALSLDVGIGPVCRKQYGFYDHPDTPDWTAGLCITANYGPDVDTSSWKDARKACNELVRLFSLNVVGRQWVPEAVYALGYTRLAEKLAQRGGRVEIRRDDEANCFRVRAPQPGRLVNEVPGMTWDRKARRLTCPTDTYNALWTAVCLVYPGLLLVNEKGITRIPSLTPPNGA